MPPRVFWLHFNRFNAKKTALDVWTIHTGGQCIAVRSVDVHVPVQTVYKGHTAPQPRAFLRGKGTVRVFSDKTAEIV